MKIATRVFDLLQNLVTGLGIAGRDKGVSSTFVLNEPSYEDLWNAYRSDWLSRKLVAIPAKDMTREWREWKADEAQIEKIEAEEKRLRLKEKVRQAVIQARLWGGAGLYLGTGDFNVAAPLNVERISTGGLKFITVLSRQSLGDPKISLDPVSENYGSPEEYTVSPKDGGGMLTIHSSRIVRFIGAPLPDISIQKNNWGDSVLMAAWQAVIDAGIVPQNIAALVHEAKVDVIKVPGLSDALSSDEATERLKKRFQLAQLLKSVNNVLLLEGGAQPGDAEEFDQKQISFEQLPNIMQQFLQIASGAADIPVTRLLGQSPAGLNSTGESDIRNYYDHVGSLQKDELEPTMETLDRLLLRSSLGSEPDGVWYEWRPLWQTSRVENSTVFKTTADAVTALTNAGVVPDEVMQAGVKSLLIDSGFLPGIEAAYDEFEAGTLEPLIEPIDLNAGIDPITGQPLLPKPATQALPAPAKDRRPRRTADAIPRPLYIYRPVVNAADIVAWAKAQGFTDIVHAADMHVTIASSATPIDWFKLWVSSPKIEIPEGGPRAVEKFAGGAIVLLISAFELQWRWQDIIDMGGSWDFPQYQPHITFTFNAGDVDISAVVAYRGKIILGPEIFEERE